MKTMRPKFVPKPWGGELWIAHTPKYTGKILFIKTGGRLSRQYHRWKDETIHVDSGILSMEINGRTRPLKEGTSLRIRPGTIHRMSAKKGPVRVIETSTSQVHDVIRLRDDYGRVERPHTRRRPQ